MDEWGRPRIQVAITKLFIIETKPFYHNIYKRDYTIDGSRDTLNRLGHMLTNQFTTRGKFSKISDLDVANNIPEIINLNLTPSRVDIPNGWREKRARFLMEVESALGSSKLRTYVQGYTDYLDHSIYGKLDPNMRMVVNSIIITSSTTDPIYGKEFINRQAFYNIIPGSNGQLSYIEELNGDMTTKKLIRPEDILTSLLLTDRHEGMGVTVVNVADEPNTCKISSRVNNSMVKYFNRVTNSFIDGRNLADNIDDKSEIFDKARSAAYEPDILKNPFLLALYDLTGNISTASFTLGDLQRLDPSMRPAFFPRESDPMVNQFGDNPNLSFMSTDDSADTMQPIPETMKACIIANELPAYMCECMVTSVSLSMTNINNENVAIVTGIQTFVSGLDPTVWIDPLLTRVRTLLMPKLSDGGMTVFEAHVVADVMGEITVSLSLYGMQPLVYRFPCYADSLYSPVLTNNMNKELLVNDFQNVLTMTYA